MAISCFNQPGNSADRLLQSWSHAFNNVQYCQQWPHCFSFNIKSARTRKKRGTAAKETLLAEARGIIWAGKASFGGNKLRDMLNYDVAQPSSTTYTSHNKTCTDHLLWTTCVTDWLSTQWLRGFDSAKPKAAALRPPGGWHYGHNGHNLR